MKKTLIVFGAMITIATYSAPVWAFSLPWATSTPQETYSTAELTYQKALEGVLQARQAMLQAQGDLAYSKAETASREHNMKELQRLTDVVERIKQEKEELDSGRLVFRWERN